MKLCRKRSTNMIIMQLSNIYKLFGAETVLSHITLDIKSNDRIAIVGRNGTGKSTLLKIMAGVYDYDRGEIFKPKDVTVGYLPQHSSLESTQTIWEEMLDVFTHVLELKHKLRLLEQNMEQASSLSPDHYNQLLLEYDKLQQTFEENGGYHYETTIKTVLSGLDFPKSTYDTPINQLSGGQKTRLALGKLLLQSPDLLILDEPTNHLDIDTLSWLEDYLNNYAGAVVIVSHDRYFLDQTISIIYELSHQRIKKYYGTYSEFLQQKQKDYEKALKDYEHQQTEIKKMEEFIQKNLVRASTTKRAQSRRKQLEKMDILTRPEGDQSSATIFFDVHKQSGYDVLKINDLSFRYDDSTKDLFSNVNLHIRRGDRIALVGPNGVGKTTFLNVILGELTPHQGQINIGANVQMGYYDQEQAQLTSSKTVLNDIWDEFPHVNEQEVRRVLGNFLFTGDDVLFPVHSLSGGEKARLSLAKLMMKKANFLILDEPTNHLDIDSKEVLEAALKDFPGTIIFVSHDRYFINTIADHVVDMQHDGVTVYLGDYDYFVEKKQEEKERAKLRAQKEIVQLKKSRRERYEETKKIQSEKRRTKREIAKLEERITKLEEELTSFEESMTLPEVYEDHEKSLEYMEHTNKIKENIEQLMEQWTTLHEQLPHEKDTKSRG